jgi:hypothetical protein
LIDRSSPWSIGRSSSRLAGASVDRSIPCSIQPSLSRFPGRSLESCPSCPAVDGSADGSMGRPVCRSHFPLRVSARVTRTF